MLTFRFFPMVFLATFCLIAGCAVQDLESKTNTVELLEEDDTWTVTFSFKDAQKAVILTQASEPYRSETWRPRTPGVSIKQFGQAEFIVFEEPAQTASFEIEPTTRSLRKAYTPFLSFTDGGWGVLEGQFRFAAVNDFASAAAYEGSGEKWPEDNSAYDFVLSSDRKIYQGGEVVSSPITLTPEGDGRYIYIGDREFEVAKNYFGVVDQGLPNWIKDRLDSDLAQIFEQLTREWGLDLVERAEILFVYDGASHPGFSQTGGAIGNQLALQVSGEALLEPDDSILDFFRWFLTHESAHLYQAAAGMVEVSSKHAWMHEGGANTMAHRIAGRLANDRDAFLSEVYNTAIIDCSGYLEQGAPLVEAIETGQFDAYYACGDLINLIIEAELSDSDVFDFWVRFLAVARDDYAGAITAELYFEQARAMGVPVESIEWIRRFVFHPVAAPNKTIRDRLKNVGLHVMVRRNGDLTIKNLPN